VCLPLTISKEDHEDEQEEPEEEEPSGKAYGDMQMSGQPCPHVQHSIHSKVFECVCFPCFSELVKREPAAEADPKSSRKAPRTKKTTAAGNRKKARSVWYGNVISKGEM